MKIEAGGIYKDGYGEIVTISWDGTVGKYCDKYKPWNTYTNTGHKIDNPSGQYNLVECIQEPKAKYTLTDITRHLAIGIYIGEHNIEAISIEEFQSKEVYINYITLAQVYLNKFYPIEGQSG